MALRDEVATIIRQIRQLINVNPIIAHRKASNLLQWAIKVPFENDEIHNHQRFLLIEEVKDLQLEAALALQSQGVTPQNSLPKTDAPKIIKFPGKS